VRFSEEARHRILNPEPGSALARARDYGIDLSLLLENLERTPQQRLEQTVKMQRFLRVVDDVRRRAERR
jgi:hypothetical protein